MKFFETDTGERVITQRPNAIIIAALGFWVVEKFTSGDLNSLVGVLTSVLLIIWALTEVFWGVNYWRKTLGTVVLIASLSSFL